MSFSGRYICADQNRVIYVCYNSMFYLGQFALLLLFGRVPDLVVVLDNEQNSNTSSEEPRHRYARIVASFVRIYVACTHVVNIDGISQKQIYIRVVSLKDLLAQVDQSSIPFHNLKKGNEIIDLLDQESEVHLYDTWQTNQTSPNPSLAHIYDCAEEAAAGCISMNDFNRLENMPQQLNSTHEPYPLVVDDPSIFYDLIIDHVLSSMLTMMGIFASKESIATQHPFLGLPIDRTFIVETDPQAACYDMCDTTISVRINTYHNNWKTQIEHIIAQKFIPLRLHRYLIRAIATYTSFGGLPFIVSLFSTELATESYHVTITQPKDMAFLVLKAAPCLYDN